VREVDVSIRYVVGTAEILVTVECRRRRSVEDVRWIEGLKAKRENLGIAKTVAVSATGFSAAAKRLADHAAIELRTLSEITPQVVAGWTLPRKVTFINVNFEVQSLTLDHKRVNGWPQQRAAAHGRLRTSDPVFETRDGRRWSLNDLVKAAIRQNPSLEDGLRTAGTRVDRNVELLTHGSEIVLWDGDSRSPPISRLSLTLTLWRKETSADGHSGAYYEYTGTGGLRLQRADYDLRAGSSSVIIGVQHNARDNAVRFSIDPA
jgi:hypothetical protein